MTALVPMLLELEQARSITGIGALLRSIAAPLGYDRVLLFAAGTGLERGAHRVYWIEGDWLGEGRETDLARYLHACPVNRHVLDSDAPFFWSKREGVRGARYQVVRRPRGDGLHGLQVPVFGTTGLEGAISFAGTIIDASAPARLLLESAGTAAFRAARRLAEAPAERPVGGLSTREREVLRWVAAGRRQAEIAATLGLSARTVENHLRRARQRLGVATTAQAVRAAARRGEIED
ncbi:PA1136 family autoinducer-binding transcriptional regulator [Stenotrophomonas maltophilia]|uniref:PA1136 family autoinducer-binding transcriptional regulator n=1 Tax=Stenotrophomonas maltophilia TaxID=40324 RepID=UPI00289576F0|nr:PA1136 family autoinducer-binding transcriptional regulator [Stenotrophomonas maltophilia]MDT3502766.1 LuxR C-terminal-related transcriptional regulator [Stenotrophomonas maltophilia]